MSIDPRLMERRKTVAEDNAKRNVGRLLKFLLTGVVVGAGVWLVLSPWLSISQVKAEGIGTSTAHAVLAENGVRAGTPMILVNASRVESLLLQDPWVAQATVDLDWPDKVTVEVVERIPVAWVRTEGGWTRRAVDGVALPSESQPDDAMARIDLAPISATEAESSIEMRGALEFVAALPHHLHTGTVVTYHDDELWARVSGHDVRLGRSDDMTEKALSLAALLEENPPAGSTLILIAPTNPAVTAPSDAAQRDISEQRDSGGTEDVDTDETNDDS